MKLALSFAWTAHLQSRLQDLANVQSLEQPSKSCLIQS